MALPTSASAGLASMPSTTGHTLNVPVTRTLPCFAVSWHIRWTVTGVVVRAVTENGAWPAHDVPPSVDVEDMATSYPLPGGSVLTCVDRVDEPDTSTEPVRVKPPGPVMVYVKESSVIPGATCRSRSTVPNLLLSALAPVVEVVSPAPQALSDVAAPIVTTLNKRDRVVCMV